MSCAACVTAERNNPRMNEFTVGCTSCVARALAATGAHEASEAAGKMTADYRDALAKLFGDGWKEGNEAVKQWAKRLKGANK